MIPPNVKQKGFSDLIDAIKPEDLVLSDRASFGPVHGDGKPAAPSDWRRASLLQAGPAQYYLQTGTDDRGAPRVLMAKDGKPFTLDLKALEPELRKRRPDLYQ